MEEFIDFLIEHGVDYHEVGNDFVYFYLNGIRYTFNFRLKRFYFGSLNFYVRSDFDSFEFKKEFSGASVDIYTTKEEDNFITIYFNKEK